MNYIEIVNDTIQYIESNLHRNLSVEEFFGQPAAWNKIVDVRMVLHLSPLDTPLTRTSFIRIIRLKSFKRSK